MKTNYWTIACNTDIYNIVDAFNDLKCIEWKQGLKNIKNNDIVYIYVGEPYQKIMYKCKVNKTNLSMVSIDNKKYCVDETNFGVYEKYMELELLKKYDGDQFKYNIIKNYNFKNSRRQSSADAKLVNYIENFVEDFNDINPNKSKWYEANKKRVDNKNDWLKVLNNEEQENNKVLDILFYLYDCKNYTSNGKVIAKDLDTDVAALNSYISSFGKRIIDLLHLKEQIGSQSNSRRWNIPFETVDELNTNNIFTWKLRKELIEALIEKYDLIPKEDSIDDKIQQFIDDYPYDNFSELIKKDLTAREYFINKFTLNNIMSMTLDDFVIGRAELDEKGKNSFCYLIERTMQNLGDMRGSFVSKFGVWFSKEEQEYKFTKKYGATLEEAFENLKKEISLLLVSANNNDYEKINKCNIANIFKGKILSTYYPDKYLCIFDEEDVDKFLNILDISYDIHIVDTLEKKKNLLTEYKKRNKLLNKYSDYYFVLFLYKTFKDELRIKNTISGEIDYYNLEFVDFEYLKKHEVEKKNSYRSRDTDYERINRNKKDIGNRGEKAVLQHEIDKLQKLGLFELSEQVRICDNDAIGYDIISFDEKGNELHIEVKTNSNNKSYLDFYITDNELQHLINEENYYIYYLFNIKGKPKCHIIDKEMILKNKKEFFQPVIYKVNVDVLEKQII